MSPFIFSSWSIMLHCHVSHDSTVTQNQQFKHWFQRVVPFKLLCYLKATWWEGRMSEDIFSWLKSAPSPQDAIKSYTLNIKVYYSIKGRPFDIMKMLSKKTILDFF